MTDLVRLLDGRSLLIFDFDGTVADSSPLHARAFEQVLEPYGIAVDYPAIAGMKTADAMRRCHELEGAALDEALLTGLVAEKQRLVREAISTQLVPLPGVDEFLTWARPRFRLAMATSGSRGTVSAALDHLGYTGWFDPFVCADDVVHAKPHPELFLTALERSGHLADEALVFEDSQSGFDAAAAAGIACFDAGCDLWQALGEVAR